MARPLPAPTPEGGLFGPADPAEAEEVRARASSSTGSPPRPGPRLPGTSVPRWRPTSSRPWPRSGARRRGGRETRRAGRGGHAGAQGPGRAADAPPQAAAAAHPLAWFGGVVLRRSARPRAAGQPSLRRHATDPAGGAGSAWSCPSSSSSCRRSSAAVAMIEPRPRPPRRPPPRSGRVATRAPLVTAAPVGGAQSHARAQAPLLQGQGRRHAQRHRRQVRCQARSTCSASTASSTRTSWCWTHATRSRPRAISCPPGWRNATPEP